MVSLKVLPEPDFLDFSLPENHIALVTDDGTDATPAVVRALVSRDWKVVVFNFPSQVISKVSPLPAGVNRVTLPDLEEETLGRAFGEIAQKYGPVGAFIHLHPQGKAELNGGIHFSETDRAIVRHVFLAAKFLKEPLNKASRFGDRSIFMTVARLDGAFGLSGEIPFSPTTGGLFGLVKTLNLEWEPVFCRAVDVSPRLDAGRLAEAVVAEIYDPNRLVVEVGYNLEGRTTLVVEPVLGGR